MSLGTTNRSPRSATTPFLTESFNTQAAGDRLLEKLTQFKKTFDDLMEIAPNGRSNFENMFEDFMRKLETALGSGPKSVPGINGSAPGTASPVQQPAAAITAPPEVAPQRAAPPPAGPT